MRHRIDITEVEAATKIRAKYLRALENEEWDLLPGPDLRQDLPAHLRGVPRARLAAARRGVQAALRAPVDEELTPFAPARRRAARPARAAAARDARPGLVVAGRHRGPARRPVRARAPGAATTTARARRTRSARRRATPTPRPPRARSKKQARGADACHPADRAHRDRQRLPGRRERQGADQQRDLQAGGRPGASAASASASRSATARRACGSAGRTIDVPDRSSRSATRCAPGKRPRELSAARRPTCA